MDSDCGTLGPVNFFGQHLASDLTVGTVTDAMWAGAARNLLRVQLRLGMFDPDSVQPFRSLSASLVDSAEHRQLALEAARQGLVLLKNEGGTLPFDQRGKGALRSVAVVGPHANATVAMQSNYHGTAAIPIVSPVEAMGAYVSSVAFAKGCAIDSADASGIDDAAAAAAGADATVVVLGLDQTQEKEGLDRTAIDLPGQQAALLDAVASAANGAPLVLVVISGGPVDLTAAKSDPRVGAILVAGYPGQSGGVAIAETLFGENNPGGKLTQTWYKGIFVDQCDMRDMNMRPNVTTGCPGRGYRFFTGEPVAKFGDGLSYTTFRYEMIGVAAAGATAVTAVLSAASLDKVIEATRHRPHIAAVVYTVEIALTNTGSHAGAETVLGFVSPPGAGVGGEPLRSLRRYEKLYLTSGARATATLRFTAHDFATTGEDGSARAVQGDWVVSFGDAGVRAVVRVGP